MMFPYSEFLICAIKIFILFRLLTFGTNRVTRYLLWKHEKRLHSKDCAESTDESHLGRKAFLMKKYVPITVGIGLLGFYISRRIRPEYRKPGSVASKWEIKIYTLLPLRLFSRVWGTMTNLDLPVFLRPKIYSFYASSFGVNLDECKIQDLTYYRSLAEFFIRPIKEECRPIDHDCWSIVSPADGKVISFGKVTSCQVEQVKGVTYSLQQFLGKQTWKDPNNNKKKLSNHPRVTSEKSHESSASRKSDDDDEDDHKIKRKINGLSSSCDLQADETIQNDIYLQRLKEKEDTELYQCVVYLAPGDYHRFHSPISWKVNFRRHFQGKLLSVNPAIASWIGNLFSINERAVYVGSWFHGFFSLTAVGATNVGSIRVQFDPSLRTNQWKNTPNIRDHFFNKDCTGGGDGQNCVEVSKGELFGEFRLGSTVVIIFEAPKNFHFDIEAGQKVNLREGEEGEPYCKILSKSEASDCLSCVGPTFRYENNVKTFRYPTYAYIAMEVIGRGVTDISIIPEFEHVIYLNLTANCLSDVSLSPLQHMKQLKALIVDKNLVESVVAVPELQKLQLLSLKQNCVSSCEVRTLENLLYLDLSHNRIRKILPHLWCPALVPKLTELSMRGNGLKKVVGFLFSNLVSLFLADNQITHLDGLEFLTNLKFLHLRNNPLTQLNGLSAVNKKLFYINLRDCKIEDAEELEKLNILPRLERIVVQGNPFWDTENSRLKLIGMLPRLRRINKNIIEEAEKEEAAKMEFQDE